MAKILELNLKQHFPIHRQSFADYYPSEKCCNDDSYGAICVKCEQCGRKFVDGILQSEENNNG